MTVRLMHYGTAASLILLTACGGGGGGGGGGAAPQSTIFADNGETDSVAISAVVLNSDARQSNSESGTFDQDAETFALGTLTGTINALGDTVTLGEGGLIEIAAGSTDHAAQFVATPQDGDRIIGIVGFGTDLADLPTGSVSYSGTTQMTILDVTDVYALTGDALVTADFSDGSVDTTLDNLNGSVTVGAAAPTNVSDVATITFTDSAIAGAGFSGGTAAITSSDLSELTESAPISLQGAFYGPGADEVGVTFIIDDSSTAGVLVQGTALAD